MPEYYVFANQAGADACIAAINGTNWFPIVGSVKGKLAPNNQQTTSWCDTGKEMLSGEYAVPRVPAHLLDALGVSQAERDAFLELFGQDIRTLTGADFPVVGEE